MNSHHSSSLSLKQKLFLIILFCFSISQGAPAQTTPSITEDALYTFFAQFEQPKFLAVEDAFQLAVRMVDPNHLEAAFTIADGYYLYRDKITFGGEGELRLAEVALPSGEMKSDAFFGEVAVFRHDFSVPIELQHTSDSKINVVATYQGCAEDGICYAPIKKTFALVLSAIIPSAFASTDKTESAGIIPIAPLGGLFGALLAGLLLAFTPCVLPMLPILSGIIASRTHKGRTGWREGVPALVYVLGSVASYAAIGALAGAAGEQLQAYFQNAWAIGTLSAVLTLMALSMFGLFTLQLPASIQSSLHNVTQKLTTSLPLIFLLGALSAVIVGACVSPVLISFLGLAIATGDAWIGAQVMMAMALGMGIPLLIFGVGAGYLLPKAAQWMEKIKHMIGGLLIAVAIYLLGTLPDVPVLLLWGTFLLIVAFFLFSSTSYISKGLSVVAFVWGVASLIGGLWGERDLFRPLPAEWTMASKSLGISFVSVRNPSELEWQFAEAAAQGKSLLLEYYADWCVDCVRMENTTFRDPKVVEVLQKNYILVRIDVTNPNDLGGKALKKRFSVFGPPATLFFDSDGTALPKKNFYGYLNPTDFYRLLTST